jgi:hypothetical protein
VAKVVTSKAGGTISHQAVVHPWLAADAHWTNKQDCFTVVISTAVPIHGEVHNQWIQ